MLAAPSTAAAEFTYGPILGRGATPDSIVIRWGTAGSAPTELDFRTGGGATITRTGAAGTDHEVVLEDLALSRTYDYVARSGGEQASATFTTCPTPFEPLDFVAYGDSRDGDSEHADLVGRIHTLMPDLVINTGDLAPEGEREEYLEEFFPVVRAMVREIPFVAATGNHDLETSFAAGFGSVMPLPPNQDGGKTPYYSVTCGNATFIALDANNPFNASQLAFLTAALGAARIDPSIQHVFAFMHHAPYSSADNHGDTLSVRQAFGPLLEDPANKVSIVFSGHDHAYERIDAKGVTYVVTGGGGAPLYDRGSPTQGGTSLRFESTHHFVHLSIMGAHIEAKAIRRDGSTIETFSVDSDVPPPPAPPGGGTDPSDPDQPDEPSNPMRSGMGGCTIADGLAGAALLPLLAIGVVLAGAVRRRRGR